MKTFSALFTCNDSNAWNEINESFNCIVHQSRNRSKEKLMKDIKPVALEKYENENRDMSEINTTMAVTAHHISDARKIFCLLRS